MLFDEEYYIKKHFVKPNLFKVAIDNRILHDEQEFSVERLFDFDHNVFITGAPGSGKTLLLKYIKYLYRYTKEFKPIFISLLEIDKFNVESIKTAQIEKRIIFLFDGLDDVPWNHRIETIKKIEALKHKHPNACFIISSRLCTNHEIGFFRDFTVLRIADLNNTQLAELFRTHGIDDWAHAYSIIQSSIALRGVVRNPMMAKLVIQYFGVIESNEYIVDPTLYIDRLVGDYTYKASQSFGFSEADIDKMLQEIAAFCHYEDVLLLKTHDIHAILQEFLGRDFDTDELLHDMERGYILRKFPSNLYAFAHSNIFEYFLTKHLRRLIGLNSSTPILDTRQLVLTGIKFKGLKERDELKNVLLGIERSLELSSSQVMPIYVRHGSIEILLALAIGGAVIHAFKKFSDGFFTKVGHITAEKNLSNKESIVLPEDITDNLPPWIRGNKEAMKIFTNELISKYAHNSIDEEKTIISIAINSMLTVKYGNSYEKMSPSQFNEFPSLNNDSDPRKIND